MTIDSLVFKNIFEINGLQQMNFRVLTKSKKIYLYKSMCYKKPVNRGFILFKVQFDIEPGKIVFLPIMKVQDLQAELKAILEQYAQMASDAERALFKRMLNLIEHIAAENEELKRQSPGAS